MISFGGLQMNKSKTPTSEKIGIPLRLEPKLYEKMMPQEQKPFLPNIAPIGRTNNLPRQKRWFQV